MVHSPEGGGDPAQGSTALPAASDFTIRLKGWRSQLRWAMTQREEDPARVWLEVISIDERSKRALAGEHDPEHAGELRKFRERLESSIASLTEDLGDDNVAPLYSWLDLVRQRRRLVAKIDEARAAVAQTRAARATETTRTKTPPRTEEDATEQLAQAQATLDQWTGAMPPEPPPAVIALWDAEGGDALRESQSQDPMAVGKRGDEARAVLAKAAGRSPGAHPWVKSRGELIAIPVAGALTLLPGLFAIAWSGSGGGTAMTILALLAALACGALVARSVLARAQEKAERRAAIDWTWHRKMYEERARLAELEVGWLRALEGAHRALRAFDAKAGTGGQLRDFEQWRPDLAEMVHEVARDTEGPS